eukprot:sb/3474004/
MANSSKLNGIFLTRRARQNYELLAMKGTQILTFSLCDRGSEPKHDSYRSNRLAYRMRHETSSNRCNKPLDEPPLSRKSVKIQIMPAPRHYWCFDAFAFTQLTMPFFPKGIIAQRHYRMLPQILCRLRWQGNTALWIHNANNSC